MNIGLQVSFSILVSSGYMPGEGNGTPLQYSCLENSMDGGAWRATVHGVTESLTCLSNRAHTHMHAHTHCLIATDRNQSVGGQETYAKI